MQAKEKSAPVIPVTVRQRRRRRALSARAAGDRVRGRQIELALMLVHNGTRRLDGPKTVIGARGGIRFAF
jgi:hypothetical protein